MNHWIKYLSFCITISVQAQNWVAVGGNIDGHQVQTLFADSTQHLLYAGGLFRSAGGIYTRNIAVLNGNNWDSLFNSSLTANPVRCIYNFKDTIIATGFLLGNFNNGIAQWNGLFWDPMGSGINSAGWCFLQVNNELLVGGSFSQAGGQPAQRLAKWDGQNWLGYDLPFRLNTGSIFSISKFNNDIFLGGNFIDTISNSIYCIGKLCQNQLCAVSSTQPFQGSAAVYKLIEFNHELIIAGEFNSPYGNNLIKWDGNSYSSFGGGTNGPVSDMLIWNNELYIAGNFTMVNGTPVSNIAKWDGNQWNRIGAGTFGNGILCMAVLDSELYVGGGFQDIDGQPITLIAKYSVPLSTIENNKEAGLSVSPNPATNIISIQGPGIGIEKNKFSVRNTLGQLVFADEILSNTNAVEKLISVSSLPSGIYFLRIETERIMITKKFVRE